MKLVLTLIGLAIVSMLTLKEIYTNPKYGNHNRKE